MKLLLTSAGIKNASIENALVELLGKPIAECDALCIPTALYGHPMAGPRQAWLCISGQETGTPTVGLGWKSMGVLELTALPSLDAERWVPLVRETDVLLVEGGDATYLCHWMRESGMADLLPSLPETVWVGVSAGSMVMTPRIGADFVTWPSATDDRTLGIVDFSIFPHLDNPDLPWNTMDTAEEWAAGPVSPRVCDRRRDRHQSRRRHRRSRLRGELEATQPRTASEHIGLEDNVSSPGAADEQPVTELDARFSDRDAVATDWDQTRRALEDAELFWIATVRADGRPHVTPLVAVWLDDAIYFATGIGEQKAVNLRTNKNVILTTGCNEWERGLDVVVEGEAVQVLEESVLERLAETWATKWDGRWHYEVHEGGFRNEAGSGAILVFSVKPAKVFAFAKGTFGQTRHRFSVARRT